MSSNKKKAEQEAYLKEIAAAGLIVAKVKQKYPQYDTSDLYRIVMLSKLTPDEKLALGLRRRKFSND